MVECKGQFLKTCNTKRSNLREITKISSLSSWLDLTLMNLLYTPLLHYAFICLNNFLRIKKK